MILDYQTKSNQKPIDELSPDALTKTAAKQTKAIRLK